VEIHHTPEKIGRSRIAKVVANQGKGQESYNLANPVDRTHYPSIQRPL